MHTKLSAMKFIKNNKRRVGVIMLAVALSFMAMYVVKFLLGSTGESFKTVMFELPKKIMFMDLTMDTLGIREEDYESNEERVDAYHQKRDELMETLKAHEGIDDVYYTQICSSRIDGIVGMLAYRFPLVEPDKVAGYLEHMDATLVEGRMPEGDGEILVDSVVFKNMRAKIGDYFYEDAYGKTFTIVGVIESGIMACVGTPNGYTNSGWAMVILCNEDTSDAKELLAEYGITLTDYDMVDDLKASEAGYKEFVEDIINQAISIIMLVIIVFLSVAVLVAYISFLRNRVDEYCLYMSIGYSKKEIYGMIMRELMIIFGSSFIAGAVFSVLLMFISVKVLLEPIGLMYCYWYPEFILTIMAANVAIIGILQIPILISINNIRTIDQIEE